MGIMLELSPVVSIALEVIAGAWGNNKERKKKLEAAGYDYARIQSCVNDLIAVFNKYGEK